MEVFSIFTEFRFFFIFGVVFEIYVIMRNHKLKLWKWRAVMFNNFYNDHADFLHICAKNGGISKFEPQRKFVFW